MKISRNRTKTATIALVLALLMVTSTFTMLSTPATVAANTSASSVGVNVATDYGDPLQYEWPQWYGNESYTFWYPGPAPDSPDLLWRTRVPGASSGGR